MANNTDELKHNQELNSKTSDRTPPIPYGSLAHLILNKTFHPANRPISGLNAVDKEKRDDFISLLAYLGYSEAQ
jgi:hypothetical protein